MATNESSASGTSDLQSWASIVGKWLRAHFVLLILLAGIALVVASAVAHTEASVTWGPIAREIGIALLIVAVATLTIESLRVKAFTDDLQKAVDAKLSELERTAADAIMRGPLPRFYYEHVKRLMLLRQTIRSSWEVRLTLKSTRNSRLQLWLDQTSVIRNLAALESNHRIEMLEGVDGEGLIGRIRYARARLEHAETWEIDEKASGDDSIGEKDGEGIRFKRSVALRPGAGLILATGSTSLARENDMFFLVVTEPAEGVRCVVDHPPRFAVTVEFPEGPTEDHIYRAILSTETIGEDLKRSTWDFPFPLVPSAAIIFYWSVLSGESAVVPENGRVATDPIAMP